MQVTVNSTTFPLLSARAATEQMNGFRRDVISLTITATYSDAAAKFTDGATFVIVDDSVSPSQEHAYTDHTMAGAITDNRDGTVTVKMGKANTAEQDAQQVLPRLVAKLREGYDVVGTIREKRKDTVFRRLASKLVNRMVRSLCNGKTMTDYGCMLRGYSRTVVTAILQCPEHGKFIPMLAMSYARRVTELNVKHADRSAGESKYNFWKLIALQYDLLTGTSIFPLRMLTYIGTIVAVLGILFGIFIFIMTRIHGDEWSQHGVFTLFSLVFIFMGGQFVAMGILGEYIGKIHMNSRGRPQFFIESVVGRKNG